jgi:hypothetical protein
LKYRIAELDITKYVTLPGAKKVVEHVLFDEDLHVYIASLSWNYEGLTIGYGVEFDDAVPDDERDSIHNEVDGWAQEFSYYGQDLPKSAVFTVPDADVQQAIEEVTEEEKDLRVGVIMKLAEYHSANAYV